MIFEQKAKDYDRDLQIIKREIEEKLKLHDRLNTELAKLIEAAGGSEDDPLQVKVKKIETQSFPESSQLFPKNADKRP